MTENARMHLLAVEDCRQLLRLLNERAEDNFGVASEEVTLEHVITADGVHHVLKEAAKLAGIEVPEL